MKEAINLLKRFDTLDGYWMPKTLAALNGQEVRIAKVKGVFNWHQHEDSEELFLVWKGCLRIEFRDRSILLNEGEALLVPRGVEHRTMADNETWIVMFERAETLPEGTTTRS